MRPLRIAMLTTFYPPYNFGGDGIGTQRLAQALVRRGHQVTVIHDVDAYNSLNKGAEPTPTPEPEGLEVRRLRSGLGVLSPLLTQQTGRPFVNGRAINKILAEGAFDVIHFNNVSLVGGPGLLSVGKGIKIYEAHEHWLVCPSHVLWRHGREVCTGRQCFRCTLHHGRPPQLWRYTGYLERQLEHVDVFIAKSEFSRAKHHEFGFSRDMTVLPYFLPDVESPLPTAQGTSPHERPYFLFVGRLEKIKGLDDVIPLFREPGNTDLLIAGDGEYGAQLRELAGDAPRVKFLGRLTPDALRRYYQHALALVVPSVCFETFGIIIIEAFRQGTPVIARRIGPFPEIIDRSGGGLLFRNAPELLDAMHRIEREPALRGELSRAGFKGFVDHWSESAVVPEYLELIRRAAEDKGHTEVADALTMENVA
jgi:glycosyltransferase involved in cell wall biosynthesis